MADNTHPPPTIHEATAGIANLSLNPNISAASTDNTTIPTDTSTDTDSTGSCPDLVPASSSDNSTDECGDDSAMQPVTAVARTITNAANGTALEINHGRRAPYGYPFHINRGVQTVGPAHDQNWRAPVYLAQRAFRDAFSDHLRPQGFTYVR